MKPIHELYREFIEKLRTLIDSQVNMANVTFETDARYLRVFFLKAKSDSEYPGAYRVEYGHYHNRRKVRFHFIHIQDLHDFIKMAIWKNPQYSTLRKEFKERDYLHFATKEMARKMKAMHENTVKTNKPITRGVHHGGYEFIAEH